MTRGALNEAFAKYGQPEIFNTDQGSQFTSLDCTSALADRGIKISMDGRHLARQRLRRTAVALDQMRGGLAPRLRVGQPGQGRHRPLHRVRQHAPAALDAGQEDARRVLLRVAARAPESSLTGNILVAHFDINPAEFHSANPGNCLDNRGHLCTLRASLALFTVTRRPFLPLRYLQPGDGSTFAASLRSCSTGRRASIVTPFEAAACFVRVRNIGDKL